MKNRNSLYVRVLLVVLSIVILMAFISRSPRRVLHDTWLPSSFNPVGAGNMAFFETLRELNWPVERWREPLGRLANTGTGNVMIITRSRSGARVTFSSPELDLLDAWIQRGNTVLLLGALDEWDDTREFMSLIGFVVPKRSDSVSEILEPFASRKTQTFQADPTTAAPSQRPLTLPMIASLPIGLPPGARTLWQSNGSPVIVEVPHGKGCVILGATDLLLSNKILADGDNMTDVLSLLTPDGQMPRHLFFEESHHGYASSYALVNLLDDPGLRFAGMLALLGALAFFATSLVRFGPILPLRRESGRSTLEFVDSIADLYLRADVRNDTIRHLFSETHQRLLARLQLPPNAPHELIASRLQQAHPQLPKWKKLAQRFDSPDYIAGLPPSGWLRVAKDLIDIKSAMA